MVGLPVNCHHGRRNSLPWCLRNACCGAAGGIWKFCRFSTSVLTVITKATKAAKTKTCCRNPHPTWQLLSRGFCEMSTCVLKLHAYENAYRAKKTEAHLFSHVTFLMKLGTTSKPDTYPIGGEFVLLIEKYKMRSSLFVGRVIKIIPF